MSRESRLRQVLTNPLVWRQGREAVIPRVTIPTGFEPLDEWLDGGWPVGVLTEILFDAEGAGELRLLMPALARLSQTDEQHSQQQETRQVHNGASWIAWIAPPHVPYPPALLQHGVNVARLLVAQPDNQPDRLWAMEQALRSTVCGAVLGWFTRADDRSLRRLQLASESGSCWAVVFRKSACAAEASPAPLRIRIQADAEGTCLHILRNRYGRCGTLRLAC
jgi:cell division inhibitor SulA/protein ImuA